MLNAMLTLKETLNPTYVSPIDEFSVEDNPYRTTCHRKDDAWFIPDQNLILWPKYEDWNEAVATCEVMFIIFSKDILDLRESRRGDQVG